MEQLNTDSVKRMRDFYENKFVNVKQKSTGEWLTGYVSPNGAEILSKMPVFPNGKPFISKFKPDDFLFLLQEDKLSVSMLNCNDISNITVFVE